MPSRARPFAAGFLGLLCLFVVAACSRSNALPAGRWEGSYDKGDVIIVARLEITPKGEIYLSAPDAFEVGGAPEDRAAVRKRLSDGLAQAWGSVEPREMEFDGSTFRKPGGVAPQMEWDAQSKQMTLVIYLGTRAPLSMPVHAVKDFSTAP